MDQQRFDTSTTKNHNPARTAENNIEIIRPTLQKKEMANKLKYNGKASLMQQELDDAGQGLEGDDENIQENNLNHFYGDSDPQLSFQPLDLMQKMPESYSYGQLISGTEPIQATLFDNEKKDIVPYEPIPIELDQQLNTNFDGDFQETQHQENYDPIQDKKGLDNVTLSTDATENHQIALEKGKNSVRQNIEKEQVETQQTPKQATRKQSKTKNRNQFLIKTVLYNRILTVVVDYYFQDANPKTKPKTGPKMKDWVFNNFQEICDIFSQRKFREEVLLKILKLNLSLSGDSRENSILWEQIMNEEELLKIARQCKAQTEEKRRYYVESVLLLREIWQGKFEKESMYKMEKQLRKQKQHENLEKVQMQQDQSIFDEQLTQMQWSVLQTQSVFTGQTMFSLEPEFFTDVQIPQIEGFHSKNLNSDETISLDRADTQPLNNSIIDEKESIDLEDSFISQLQKEEDLMIDEMDFLHLGLGQESEVNTDEKNYDLWID